MNITRNSYKTCGKISWIFVQNRWCILLSIWPKGLNLRNTVLRETANNTKYVYIVEYNFSFTEQIGQICVVFFVMTRQPLLGQTVLIIEASRSHTDTSYSVGLLWTSDQPDAETSTCQHTTPTSDTHP